MMEDQKSPVKEESSRERGLLHLWRGYSSSVTPERVLLSRPVLQAALGISHGILLAEGGLVYSFGDLTWRQGLRIPPTYPLLESVLSGQCVVSVAAGSFHCGAVTREGAVYMWGENSSGQCGLSERGLVPDPSLVSMVDSEAVPPQIIRILEVTCGEQHTLALSAQHEVWAWGSGCQLGLVTSVFPVWRPQKVEHLAGRHVVQVACGGYHSLALVRRFPAQDSQFPRPTATEKCAQCNQLLFSMVDKDDHVIISHSHYCPLGIEMADSKPGSCSRSRQASPARQASQSRQASLAQRHRASACPLSQTVSLDLGLDPDLAQDPDPIIGPEYLFPGDTDSFLRESGSKEQTNQEDTGTSDLQRQGPGTLTETDSNSSRTQARRKTSSSTDEKELKEYLKRTSDHILSEQNDNNNTGNPITLANQTTGDSLTLANQTTGDSLTLANETAEDSLTLASHSSGDLLTLVSHVPGQCLNGDLPDQYQPSTLTPYLLPQSTDDTTMASSLSCSLLENYTGALGMEHTLALTGRAASASPFEVNTPLGIGSTSSLCDSSKSEGCIPVAGLCEALSGPVMAYRKTNQEVRLCMEEDSLQGKKCSSLTDILLEEVTEGSRRHSLPPLLSHASPEFPGRRSSRSRPNVPRKEEVVESLPSLNTEVWSWGRGQEGQLGHGDQLPRLQPLCIKSLNGEEVVKVVAGTHHSLALSAQCQVFSWGSNRSGQLGHMNSPTTMPQQAKMSEGLRVWDLAAGQSHSVFLADGDCCQPILCYSGQQVMETTPENHIPGTGSTESSPARTDTYTLRPVLLPFCMNMGYISSVYGGGQSCLAQADLNVMGFISALHELAAADRKYYCRLRDVNKRVVSPLLRKESVCTVLGQTSSLLFQSLASSYSRLCHLTGQHSVSLTAFLHTDRDVKGLVILKHANTFLDMYKEYCGSVGNFLVMGGFQALMKPSVECFGKKFEVLRQLSESSEDKVPLLDLLVLLFYSPMQHIHEYARLLLKLATCFDVSTVEYQRLQEGCSKYEALSLSLGRKRKEAETTNQFWRTYSGKTTDVLRNPQRRLVYESSNKSLTLQNAGRFSVNWFILFNDALIHAQGTIPSKSFFSSHHVYSLATLWVEPITASRNLYGIKVTTPEESFTLIASSAQEKAKWLRAINQAVEAVLTGEGSGPGVPAVSRTASYIFYKDLRLKDASYSGRWLSGKPHGKGIMKWPDGRKFTGTFKQGLEDGYGDCIMPNKILNKSDCYQGHWRDGKMHGFGTYRYATGQVYEGSFHENIRQGHGMLSSGKLLGSSSSVFVGQWLQDKKMGYGVFDDITRGEKYMGLWTDDQRQGSGVVVTQFGLYYEGTFSNNKMVGTGLLVSDDDTAFEGEFSEDWTPNGKGYLSMSNGDSIEGLFSGEWTSGLKITGTYMKPNLYEPDKKQSTRVLELGRLAVSPEQKWKAVFSECWSRLGCEAPGQPEERTRAWENIAVTLTTGRRDSPELLSRSQSRVLEKLEVIPQHTGPVTAGGYDGIRRYLTKACETPLHPLGGLLETLVTVYRITYIGVGSNRRLLQQAVEEIRSYLIRIFQLVRFLFPDLPDEGGVIHPDPKGSSETDQQGLMVSSSTLLLPVLLPRLYPPLFTLYALDKEREEEVYWDCVLRLNKQPDLGLLAFLGVLQKFWPVSVSVLGEKQQVLPSTKNACFASAVKTLQQISNTFTPSDKLQVIQRTFEELNQEVQALLEGNFLLSMDDLLPLFLYVVLRARMRNLAAEVSFIEDLMDPSLQHGELGLMFTTLKACCFQIQQEKTT
ncbi:alsin isoform X1 [Oncorhynchus clarkii lewisi]|uniref:alsin isoform X1 n=1 Tax=Oncorhynchus clarkii lewisi TaxID=490388 RepID=UPI0039B8A52C